MSKTPQVIVSLTPSGGLKVELPGFQATRRSIDLRVGDAGQSLLRILLAQQLDQTEIGLDGAPTTQQLRHWERHGTWPDSRCRFCLAEGRIGPSQPKRRQRELICQNGEAKVTRLPAKAKGAGSPVVTKRTTAELGL